MPNNQQLADRIEEIRRDLGDRLLILGHHYQREEVIVHTDLRGDSFQLSAAAAENDACRTIVFCGVHFMAETADILANSPEKIARRGHRRADVVLPDLKAGCSMADMATGEEVQRCWDELATIIDIDDVTPITYVNSSAELKAFCGRHGGIACTSTNAASVLKWALSQRRRVLFFPDQHLGRNTALKMGFTEDVLPLWDRNALSLGGLTEDILRRSRIILWNGYCNVHQNFTVEQIDTMRKERPGIRVIVHPECCRAVVDAADEAGSTSFILKRITESAPGSIWAVGTESRFVERLAKENPDKTVLNLSPQPSYCETMSLIELPKLAEMLEAVAAGTPKNVIRVDESVATEARLCLNRMLDCP